MKTFFSRIWQYKPFRVFVWNTINGIITLGSGWLLAQVNPTLVALTPIIMSGLTLLTKWLNTKYFNDLGVNETLPTPPVQ